jgi:hypothetical protein
MSTVRELRRITAARQGAKPLRRPRPAERCDLCGGQVAEDHRHLLQVEERQILCACEACFALRSGDAVFTPTGRRVVWVDDFELRDEIWAAFRIPIGLAFFFRSSATDGVVALYPSPAGATESELDLAAWALLEAGNPVLGSLATDAEALIVNRMSDPPQYAIAPIDRCYALVGLVKTRWVGISGGTELKDAIQGYFDALRRDAEAAG